MSDENLNQILIIEDESRFGLSFGTLLKNFTALMNEKSIQWDIL
jgi:hypothetical protein